MRLERGARSDLQKLLAETGHSLTIDDIEDVFTLNELWRKIRCPESPVDLELTVLPVCVGNVVFHPLTLGVLLWLEECRR